jgi:Ca2+-binding EF-hand superfamily protein
MHRSRDQAASLLLPKVSGAAGRPPASARMASTKFQPYSDFLPDRYLSKMTPFSTPLYDARVHVARAKAHFKRKLHALVNIFVRVDKNQNGLIPRSEVRRCLAGAGILLPRVEVEAMLDQASARNGEIYWRAITLRLGKIEFNANDGLDQVELALIAGEFASVFDNDGDGYTTVQEIESTFAKFDADNDGHIGSKELGSVMRTLGTPRKMTRADMYRGDVGDEYNRVVYGARGAEGSYTGASRGGGNRSARY